MGTTSGNDKIDLSDALVTTGAPFVQRSTAQVRRLPPPERRKTSKDSQGLQDTYRGVTEPLPGTAHHVVLSADAQMDRTNTGLDTTVRSFANENVLTFSDRSGRPPLRLPKGPSRSSISKK